MPTPRVTVSAVLCRDVSFDAQRVATLHDVLRGEIPIPPGATVATIECRVFFSIMFRESPGSHSISVVMRNRAGAEKWRSDLPPIEIGADVQVSVGAPRITCSGSAGVAFMCVDVDGVERWSTALLISANPARPNSPPPSSATFG